MIKINKITNTASRESLPQFLQGLKPESLYNLSWTGKSLGVQDNAWFDERDVTVYDSNMVLDGTESFEVDFENHLVNVTRGQRAKTQEELELERKSRVPQIITMRQIRLQLTNVGLRGQVEDTIASSNDYTLKDWWEYSLEYSREHPILLEFASTLGLSDIELDDMFIQASTL